MRERFPRSRTFSFRLKEYSQLALPCLVTKTLLSARGAGDGVVRHAAERTHRAATEAFAPPAERCERGLAPAVRLPLLPGTTDAHGAMPHNPGARGLLLRALAHLIRMPAPFPKGISRQNAAISAYSTRFPAPRGVENRRLLRAADFFLNAHLRIQTNVPSLLNSTKAAFGLKTD
jgi:hypothetical protein